MLVPPAKGRATSTLDHGVDITRGRSANRVREMPVDQPKLINNDGLNQLREPSTLVMSQDIVKARTRRGFGPVSGLSETLCKWRDLKVRGLWSWSGEDHPDDRYSFD